MNTEQQTGWLPSQGLAHPLTHMVEELAADFVLAGEGGGAGDLPGWVPLVAETLAEIRREAARLGEQRAESLARELERRIEDSRASGGDWSKLREDLEGGGVSGLREALTPVTQDAGAALAQDPELLNDFIVEARDHLNAVESRVLILEQAPDDVDSIHSVFRGFHTIKGLAGFLEFQAMQEVAHETETLLDLARNGKLAITPEITDMVLAAADFLAKWLDRIELSMAGGSPEAAPAAFELLKRIRAQVPGGDELAQSGLEQLAASVSTATPAGEASAAGDSPRMRKRDDSPGAPESETRLVKVDTGKLDSLVDMAGELVIAQSLVVHDPALSGLRIPRLTRNLGQLGRITAELQKTAMSMRMVPISQLFRRMTRLVRDLCRKSGKQAELISSGDDTELDRHIVEELADPLMHMVRNAVDHGLEPALEREMAGKPPVAEIRLSAAHQSGHIVVQVSDDGRGLDREKILRKAVERGLVSEGVSLSDADVFNLIFQPGFSTAAQVTDVSGRGVGMDVVRRQIQKLRGRIEIQSQAGRGTTFLLKLPLTLAIIDGLVVVVGRERYVVPIFVVKEMIRPDAGTVFTVEQRDEMVLVRGKLLPIVRLHRLFGVGPRSEDVAESLLIVTEAGDRTFCLLVDELIGKQEVVIKSLGETFKNIRGIAGGAILGDGRVGLILDVDSIFQERAHGLA